MSQISLKELESYSASDYFQDIKFTSYPGAVDCLKNLSKLTCSSFHNSEFFHQLSQVCHHIRSLCICLSGDITSGFMELISVQRNLKHLDVFQFGEYEALPKIAPLLTKHSTTLTSLLIEGCNESIMFIANFVNLQELELRFCIDYLEDFKRLQHVNFSQLRVLKFNSCCPKHEYLFEFLKNNGKSLQEFCVGSNVYYSDCRSLNLAIPFCPNLQSLSTTISKDEVETLISIFNCCQQLKRIALAGCGSPSLEVEQLLEVVAKHSSKTFHEIIMCYEGRVFSEYFSKEIESFFISWANRRSQKSISIVICGIHVNKLVVNKEVIERYTKLGVVKKFEVSRHRKRD